MTFEVDYEISWHSDEESCENFDLKPDLFPIKRVFNEKREILNLKGGFGEIRT